MGWGNLFLSRGSLAVVKEGLLQENLLASLQEVDDDVPPLLVLGPNLRDPVLDCFFNLRLEP
jgi:hypothetical protein